MNKQMRKWLFLVLILKKIFKQCTQYVYRKQIIPNDIQKSKLRARLIGI